MEEDCLDGCLVSALVAASFTWIEGPSVAQGADGRHRVVTHLNSGGRQVHKGALGNIKHLYQQAVDKVRQRRSRDA